MQHLKLPIILTFALLTSVALAETATKTDAMTMPPDKGMMHRGHGMGGMMNMTEEQKEQHLRAMQEHMLKMHDLSSQILAEKDPAKKEQLKKQQLDLMKAHHEQKHMQMMEHQGMKK